MGGLVRHLALLAAMCVLGGCGNQFAALTGGGSSSDDLTEVQKSDQKPGSFVLTGVLFDRLSKLPNPSKVSDAELRAVADPMVGKHITINDLRQIATSMEGKFREAGYPYARVILPPQKIKGGLVTFSVVEGWVQSVSVTGPASVEKAQTELRLKGLENTGPVAVDDIEREVALLQRTPGLQSHVAIARGTEGPGSMKLIADAKRKDPKYLLNVQNYGTPSLGREGVTIYAEVPGAAPYGDKFEFAAYNTIQYKEQSSAQLTYERGLTASGLKGRVSGTYARAKPTGAVAVLGLASESETFDASLSYPVLLRHRSSIDASVGFSYDDFVGELFNGTVPFSNDHTRSVYLGLDGKTRFSGWRLAGGTQLRRGVDLFNASHLHDSNLARPEADPEALITLGNFDVTAPEFYGFHAKAHFAGQFSARPLMAVDEFSFGNYTIVRGYDPGSAAGDSAVAAAFDVSGFQQTFWQDRVGAELTAFYDVGRYWNHDSTGTAQRTISSFGGGVRVTFSGLMRADLTYAVPTTAPMGQGESKPVPRLLFSITTDIEALWEKVRDAWRS